MVSKSDRRRQLARAHYERQQARRSERAHKSRKRRRVALVGTLLIALIGLTTWGAWWLMGGGVDEDDFTVADGSTATAPADGTCTYTPSGTASKDVGVPPAEPGTFDGAWAATMTINGKPVTADLDAANAPCTVDSLQFLAGQGYFDATTCHRLTTSDTLKVLQCGDPAGDGTGGPGYSFANENTEGATYPAGTLAMANSGGTDSNGSQFFIVYGDSTLDPNYTVVGQITTGLDVVQAIAAAGVAGGTQDGAPSQTVSLDSLTVTQT